MKQIEIYPGAWHLTGYLSADQQRWLLDRCRKLGEGEAGFYQPTVRGGAKMRLEMLCLGLHWNATTYTYERVRSDHDGLPAPSLPADLADLARRAAAAVGMTIQPEVCIVNRYTSMGKLGLHQDKDEQQPTLDAGIPVVSLSVGDAGRFLIGGTRRKDDVQAITLGSGDAVVMGGLSRLRYHGVARILPGTAPSGLAFTGRVNLTFRQFAV